jgi:hypothetical protein
VSGERPGPDGEAGQSTLEVVALLPTLALAALTILQVLVAGATSEYAGHAAEAGAVAILEDHDPAAAARSSLPAWTGRHVAVTVRGRLVRVRLRPRGLVPFVADALASTAEARAGAGR